MKSVLAAAALALSGTVASAEAAEKHDTRPLAAPGRPAGETPFTTLTPEQSGVTAVNTYDDPRMWNELFREFTLGAVGTGATLGDFDGDDRPDLVVANKTAPFRLYRQTGPLQFTDVTEQAGLLVEDKEWNTGVTFVDVNNDGWLDLYVCRFNAANLLYLNQGDGTFKESAAAYGLAVKDASVMASFADYDRDGHLDLYLQTNILNYAASFKGRPDFLFRNNGDGTFTDVSANAGIWGPTQGHSAIWWDFNDDGWPDLYAANDFENPDKLYRNNGDGTFTDVIETVAPHTSYSSMGSDLGDINNDGRTDFLVSDMAATSHYKDMTGIEEMGRGIWEGEMARALCPQYPFNALYLNNGSERLFEIAHQAGLRSTDWTWSVRFADLDNDGFLDLHVTNGMIRNFMDADLLDKQNVAATLAQRAAVYTHAPVYSENNLAFRNTGRLSFDEVGKKWGLDHLGVSFGAAYADLDRDGDLDIVFTNYEAAPTVVRNDSTEGTRLLIRLQGTVSNSNGIGATVRLRSKSGVQVRQLTLTRGLMSSDEPRVHFGLGSDSVVDELTVSWPSGHEQTLRNVRTNQYLTVVEPRDPAPVKPRPAKAAPPETATRFRDVTQQSGARYAGEDVHFDEFTRQILLPRRLSIAGPGMAVETTTHGEPARVILPGQALVREQDGRWRSVEFAERKAAGIAPLLLHVNDDDLPDLYVATGGVAHASGNPALADKLYFGQEDGSFAAAPAGSLPANPDTTGAVVAADFDLDGDLDLFVGARVLPGKYPDTPRSLLLRNDHGTFVDVTDEVSPGLSRVGLVTSALWSDVDGDGRVDLLVACEWGPIRYWHNEGGRLVEKTEAAGLAGVTGWWSSINGADVNGDGRIDYLVGNVGLNTKYRASPARPVVLLAGSLDGSPKQNIIEAHYEGDRLYPVRGRSKMAYAMPGIRRKFKTFAAFASASAEEIVGPERLAAARRLEANQLASGVLLNHGGTFTFYPLPDLAQVAPIYGTALEDFDGDGHVDLLAAQNFFGPEPKTGRFDGGMSLFLRGNGRGEFEPVWPLESGIVVKGDAKGVVTLDWNRDHRPDVLVTQNAGELVAYENTHSGNQAFSVSVKGSGKNPHGIGSRVRVRYASGRTETRELYAGASHFSQSAPMLFFGQGKNAAVEISVRLPDGTTKTVAAPKTSQHVVVE